MWARIKSFNKSSIGGNEVRANNRSPNIREEYLSAFKTKSYADFQLKVQLLATQSSFSSPFCYTIFLEPGQEAIATILQKSNFSKKSKLKTLFHNYFNISAEASNICSDLLKSIIRIRTNYKFIQRALNTIGDEYSPSHLKFVSDELRSFNLMVNPFANPNHQDFKLIHARYSSVLHHLKSKKKKITKKIKILNCFKHTTGACVAVACGAAAIIAVIVAAHTLCGLLMGPAILTFPIKKKIHLQYFESGFLKKVGKQVDVAAKGAYILNRDFDTMSRLVSRLYDEIEHSKTMIRFCLERVEDKFSLQEVMKELRKSDLGFRKQLEDLEEHVCLCLVTINRARCAVISEMISHISSC
ncbi:hypothetical protein ACHQM5_022159 [Ranunculus cassubicifolius]